MSTKDQIAALQAQVAELQAQVAKGSASSQRRGAVLGLGLVAPVPMPRQKFQDWLFDQNREWRLSDEELAILNRVEHPTCTGRMDTHIVVGMRRLYNEGKHSKSYSKPAVPTPKFVDGKAVGEFAKAFEAATAPAPAEQAAEQVVNQ